MRFQRGENSMVRKELFHLKILRTCSEQCLEYCVFVVSNALKCYQCSSEDDPECMENFDTGNEERFLTSTECEVNAARYCIKTTGIFGGVVGTRRFCSSRDLYNACQYITYPDHDRVYRACVFTCRNDDCNASSTSTWSMVALAFSFMFLSIFLY